MCGMASGVLSATSDRPHCSCACRVAHEGKGANAQLGYSKSRLGCDVKTTSLVPPLSIRASQASILSRASATVPYDSAVPTPLASGDRVLRHCADSLGMTASG